MLTNFELQFAATSVIPELIDIAIRGKDDDSLKTLLTFESDQNKITQAKTSVISRYLGGNSLVPLWGEHKQYREIFVDQIRALSKIFYDRRMPIEEFFPVEGNDWRTAKFTQATIKIYQDFAKQVSINISYLEKLRINEMIDKDLQRGLITNDEANRRKQQNAEGAYILADIGTGQFDTYLTKDELRKVKQGAEDWHLMNPALSSLEKGEILGKIRDADIDNIFNRAGALSLRGSLLDNGFHIDSLTLDEGSDKARFVILRGNKYHGTVNVSKGFREADEMDFTNVNSGRFSSKAQDFDDNARDSFDNISRLKAEKVPQKPAFVAPEIERIREKPVPPTKIQEGIKRVETPEQRREIEIQRKRQENERQQWQQLLAAREKQRQEDQAKRSNVIRERQAKKKKRMNRLFVGSMAGGVVGGTALPFGGAIFMNLVGDSDSTTLIAAINDFTQSLFNLLIA